MAVRWFVYHYQIDVTTGKRKRVTTYGNINKFNTPEQRMQAAERLIATLTGNVSEQLFRFADLTAALRGAAENRKPWIGEKQYKAFAHRVNVYERYVKFSGTSDMIGFVNYLKQYTKLCNTSVNHYLDTLNTLFAMLESNGLVNANPVKKVKRLKERRNHGKFFTTEQREVLKRDMNRNAPHLVLPAKWVYYCCLRPDELRRVRLGDLRFHHNGTAWNGTVTVAAGIAKDAEQRIVNIPEPFVLELLELGYNALPPSFHVVSHDGFPGPDMVGKNFFWKHFRRVLDRVAFEPGYYFYGWKHTGNFHAHQAGITLKELQIHNGHSDIRTTDNYFGNMSAVNLIQIKTKYPTF